MVSREALKLNEILRNAPKAVDMDLPHQREAGEHAEDMTSEPEGVRFEDAPTVGGLWATPQHWDSETAIMYLYGGGYVISSPHSRRKLAGHLANASGARSLIPRYHLAPERPFPTAVEDAAADYRWLLGEGGRSERTVVAGDSSAGGLAVATMLKLRQDGEDLPAGGVLISPWVDLACTGETLEENAAVDLTATKASLQRMAGQYLHGADPRTPLASPLQADLSGLPPLLIVVGGYEALVDDSVRLARVAGMAGVDLTLYIGAGMQHIFPNLLWHDPRSRRSGRYDWGVDTLMCVVGIANQVQKRNSANFDFTEFQEVRAFRYPVLNHLALSERRELVELGGKGRHETGSSDALIDYDRVADVYDLYVTSDLDVGFYVEEATKVRGKVLELMCGTGRVSVPLLEAGVDLTCVDVSAGMLRRLEERLHAHKLDARVVRADIRHLDLGEEEFELALIPFHSFSELVTPRDQELALRAVFGCLREGGRLICPLHNPTIRARSTDGALRFNGSFPTADGGLLLVSGFETLDESSGVVDRLQFYEFFDASNELLAKRVLPMRFALIDRSGFAEAARGAGLVPVALYGDYDRGEYLEESSPFMVWILEKAKHP